MNIEDIDPKMERSSNFRLCGRVISFEPHNPESIDALLSEFGPEGLYEIVEILKKAADDDVSEVYLDNITGDLCDTAIIKCPSDTCGATSCNCMGCTECVDDTTEFNKQKTRVEEYLTDEEINIYHKCRRLKHFILMSLEAGESEIDWKRLDDEGMLSQFDCELFTKELEKG